MKYEIYTGGGVDITLPTISCNRAWGQRDTTLPFYLLVLGVSIIGLLAAIFAA